MIWWGMLLHLSSPMFICAVQLSKQRESDIRAPHSGPYPSQDDEHRAAHSEGGKEKFTLFKIQIHLKKILLAM